MESLWILPVSRRCCFAVYSAIVCAVTSLGRLSLSLVMLAGSWSWCKTSHRKGWKQTPFQTRGRRFTKLHPIPLCITPCSYLEFFVPSQFFVDSAQFKLIADHCAQFLLLLHTSFVPCFAHSPCAPTHSPWPMGARAAAVQLPQRAACFPHVQAVEDLPHLEACRQSDQVLKGQGVTAAQPVHAKPCVPRATSKVCQWCILNN